MEDDTDANSLPPHEPENDDDAASTSGASTSSQVPRPTWAQPKNKNTAVWSDPSDARVTVSLSSDKRLRKLRDALTEDTVNGKTYESKLRRK